MLTAANAASRFVTGQPSVVEVTENASSVLSELTRWRLAAGRAPSSTATMANCSRRNLVPIFGFMPYVSKEHGWASCGGAVADGPVRLSNKRQGGWVARIGDRSGRSSAGAVGPAH